LMPPRAMKGLALRAKRSVRKRETEWGGMAGSGRAWDVGRVGG
jgi:hypothetical protein